MTTSFVLARDYLQRAAVILQDSDDQGRQVRYIIERTINLIDDLRVSPAPMTYPRDNVLDLASFRARHAAE